jgi:NAD(P)-dependent dehydrogenase (short-subunit alcohol dehydrogenase family)
MTIFEDSAVVTGGASDIGLATVDDGFTAL